MIKFPKISEACSKDSIRESLFYIKFTKEAIVCSDSRILVCHKTADFFESEFIKQISEDGFFIHKDDFKKIENKDIVEISFKDKTTLKIDFLKGRALLIELDEVKSFPDMEVFNLTKFESTSDICLNVDNIVKLQKALSVVKENLIFKFNGEFGMVKVQIENSKSYGIIMPCLTQAEVNKRCQ